MSATEYMGDDAKTARAINLAFEEHPNDWLSAGEICDRDETVHPVDVRLTLVEMVLAGRLTTKFGEDNVLRFRLRTVEEKAPVWGFRL